MLNLEGLRVEGVKETDDEYTITVSVTEEPPAFCNACFYNYSSSASLWQT